MNATERLILEELKALKEFLFDKGLSNPIWVLLVPLVCGLFASQILWMIYVLWLERPIVVNRKHMKEEEEEEEAEIGGDAEGTKREGVKGGELETVKNKERKELKEDREGESDGDQKAPSTPLRYEVQPSMAVASIFPLPLPEAQLSYFNPSVSEPNERRQHEQIRIIFTTANSNRKMRR
ncbi:unnamed protein product [Taenia asiatica]|uniref:Transmembrane protein n=1 Tax=Taenia asiatica TaxID=60517 RepID=A0A0R3W480_TAEAS|nr:unnamed protein product [Taenia asiatica]